MEIIKVQKLHCSYPGFTLEDISLSLAEGTLNLLIGSSGSGKTTLLQALALGGDSDVFPLSYSAAMVPQRPEVLMAEYETPRTYLASCLAGLPAQRLGETLGYFSLGNLADRKLRELSAGQLQLVAVAGALVSGARLLILDEPAAQLDPIHAMDFISLLRRLCRELNITVLLSEHRTEVLFPIADQVIVLDDGRLIAAGSPREIAKKLCDTNLEALLPLPARIWSRRHVGDCPLSVSEGRAYWQKLQMADTMQPKKDETPQGETVLALKRIWFRYEKTGADILQELSLYLHRGEIFCILGGNGAGKTTTLGVLSGRLHPYSGKRVGTALCISQDPRPIFGDAPIGLALTDNPYVDILGIGKLLDRTADRLSCGEMQLAALCWALGQDAKTLLLDEPTRGMDPIVRDRAASLLQQEAARGRSFLLVSHDTEFCARTADRCALFFRGRIIAEGTPREFFRGNLSYTTAAGRMTGSCTTAEDILKQMDINQ